MSSKEGQTMLTMKKRVKATGNILFKKRKEVQSLTNDLEDVNVRLQNTNDEKRRDNFNTYFQEQNCDALSKC